MARSIVVCAIALVVIGACADKPERQVTKPDSPLAPAFSTADATAAEGSTICAAYRRELVTAAERMNEAPDSADLAATVASLEAMVDDVCN